MLVLLTNDDGIHSEGLFALKNNLEREHNVWVVAPERERTCVGHAITLHKPLRIRKVQDRVFATNGTPADCVLLGARAVLEGVPDVIVSGINRGPNMGQDVNYSGTVAAANEGARLGILSLAVSVVAREDFLFSEATRVVSEIIGIMGACKTGENVFFNVNIPNIPYDKIKGFMLARLGKRIYNDIVVERTDPRGGKYYWIGGNGDSYEPIRGTDFYAVERGYVSVTPLSIDGRRISLNHYRKIIRRCV